MIPYIYLFIVIAVWFATLPKIFEKAGEESWKGYVPVYNWLVWLRIMKKPWWWIILLIVPGVNFLMLIIMHVELSKSFNLRTFKDGLLAVLAPMYTLPMLAFKEEHEYVGPIVYDEDNKKSRSKEWTDAILFAVVAATIIRTFFLEAFTIPTPSMENSMLVGDYLFVSKVSYGAKLPNTPISFPFTHHTFPLTESTKSYVEWFSMPYMRLPGFGDVNRNDVVVFNFPEGDTVIADNQGVSYYSEVRNRAFRRWLKETKQNSAQPGIMQVYEKDRERYELMIARGIQSSKDILVRPVDKRENYIKRCLAIPGDTIKIIDKVVYINGKRGEAPEEMMFSYMLKGDPIPINQNLLDRLKNSYDISQSCILRDSYNGQEYMFGYTMTASQYAKLKETDVFAGAVLQNDQQVAVGTYNQKVEGGSRYLPIFPNDAQYNWTRDNFGPVCIPKEGATVQLNKKTLPLYERVIDLYEGHDLKVEGDNIYIDGQIATSYTFQMNYYWLMGDNRHNSQDSRFWGFVPEDHVVGKAVFVWFSKDPQTGIRWDRIFSLVD